MLGKENNDDTFIVFVQLWGLQRMTRQNGWMQMQAKPTDSFADLLQSTLNELQKLKVLDDSQALDIGCLSCGVSHCPTKKTNAAEKVICTLQSACRALPMAGNHHVRCSFGSGHVLEKLQAPCKKDPFATMMQARQQRFFPDKHPFPEEGKSPQFNLQLFNFVVDCLTARDCSVTCEQARAAKKLALAMRDVLQMLASTKIPKGRMPDVFRHSLKPFNDRHRTSQHGLNDSLNSLQKAVMDAQPFLKTSRWKLFADEV
jgi:hypothetical protein